MCVFLSVMCLCVWWECMWLVYVFSWRVGDYVCFGRGLSCECMSVACGSTGLFK